jgi:hypothetical protein
VAAKDEAKAARVHIGGAVARGSEGGGVDLRRCEDHGGESEGAEQPADGLRGQRHESRGHERSEGFGESVEERVRAAGGGHHQRHGEQHRERADEQCEEGAKAEVGALGAVVVVGFALCGGQGGVVTGVADGIDQDGWVDGRGCGDLRGVRHEVDAGGVDARDRLKRVLDVDLASGAGHALNLQRLFAHAPADSTKVG